MFKIILPTINFKIERWKWNKEYRVYVSTLGHIKNKHKQNLPIKINQSGYCYVFTNCGLKCVHRLVMLTFKPIPNAESLTVDHLNHNKRDNSIYNLEWVTKEENEKRANLDYIKNNEKQIRIISSVREEANRIIKNITTEGCPKRTKIENKIIKSINENISYCGVYYKMKGEE